MANLKFNSNNVRRVPINRNSLFYDAEMFALSREYKTKVGVMYDNRLEWLKNIAPDIKEPLTDAESDNNDTEQKAEAVKEHQPTAKDKIQEMIDRLNNQEFTRFWP
jgi:hypothetical protein